MTGERTKLDSIDRRTNPKEWSEEWSRINRERDARLGCLRIALQTRGDILGETIMLNFVRPSDIDYEIRLRCLKLAAQVPSASDAVLVARAENMLRIVTEADNG